MTFAEDFKREATPRLRHAARLNGLFVACGLDTFAEAHQAIHEEASYVGAGFLPEEIYDDLCEWITTTLLAEIIAAEQRHGLGGSHAG